MATHEVDYSSIYALKTYAREELIPKYFNMDTVNDINVGLLGYVTELATNTLEDTFNTVSVLMNEMFPNLAVIPETIYTNAALFKMSGLFSTPAELNCVLFIPEESILTYGKKVKYSSDITEGYAHDEELYEFFIGADTLIDVAGKPFFPDYDIRITYKPYRGSYIFTAMYYMYRNGAPYKNGVSSINDPYIKLKQTTFNGVRYVVISVMTHQVNIFSQPEQILTNDVINVPTYTIEFDEPIANFDVFYTAPGSSPVQLEKKLTGAAPTKTPFCYYKFVDENKLQITFTSRNDYFQPAFNSDLNIIYQTTLGSKGNFPNYTGNDIVITPRAEYYDYNSNVVIFAVPMSASRFGADALSLEQLSNATIEKFSTVESYTTENDLSLYFKSFNNIHNSDILFIKTRDDQSERLFTGFSYTKDTNSDIYHTNTLDLIIKPEDFDISYEQTDASIMRPGKLFTYREDSLDTAKMVDGHVTDEIAPTGHDFLYTNPFMIYFSKDPTLLGYYLNTVDSEHMVQYTDINLNSMMQFICYPLKVQRNALEGETKYKLSVTLTPTSELEIPIVKEETDNMTGETATTFTDALVVRLFVEDNGKDIAFLDMKLTDYDLETDMYTYECEIETDDYVTDSNKVRVTGMFAAKNTPREFTAGQKLIPMTDAVINICTYYKNDDTPAVEVGPDQPANLTGYTFTNKFSTTEEPVTFIYPILNMRSRVQYIDNGDGYIDSTGVLQQGTYSLAVTSVPFIAHEIAKDKDSLSKLITYLFEEYEYMNAAKTKVTSNFGVDLKLYNTYGKSKNFRVGDAGEELLDRTNIKIKFKVKPVFGTNEEDLIRDLKIFIKDYIESINENGTNSIYISNMIQSIENKFSAVKYLKFVGINEYDSDVQVIENKTVDLTTLSKEDRIRYVPEYLTIRLEDIILEIIV